MIYKTYNNKSYNIYTIKTNKFKTCHMEIIFRNNIERETITKRGMLTEMLVENSKKYKTRREMIIELEELYKSIENKYEILYKDLNIDKNNTYSSIIILLSTICP